MNDQLKFDWFDEPDDAMILLKPNISEKLLRSLKDKLKYNRKIIEIIGSDKFIYQLRKDKPIRIKTLKRILENLDLDYSDFSNYVMYHSDKSYFSTRFPIYLDKKESAILIGAFMSDGNNQFHHPFYANMGFLGDKILKTVQTFFPNILWEIRNDKLRFHPILSRLLLKLGVPIGNKTLLNPRIPDLVYKNKEYRRAYLIQIFDDEGHAPTKISRKIVLGRSVALKKLPKDFVSDLFYNRTIYFNSLPENIKKTVNKQPPNLLKGESKLLEGFGIRFSMRCRSIAKYLDGISASWVIEIAGKENIRKFNKEIGFSHPDKVKQINNYLEG